MYVACSGPGQPRHKNWNAATETTIPEKCTLVLFQFHGVALLLQQGGTEHSSDTFRRTVWRHRWSETDKENSKQEPQRSWKTGLMILCGVTTSLCTLTTELLNTAWQFSTKKAQGLNWTIKGMCTRFISSRIIKHRTWLSQPSLTELLKSASQILYFSCKWRSTGWSAPHLSQETQSQQNIRCKENTDNISTC